MRQSTDDHCSASRLRKLIIAFGEEVAVNVPLPDDCGIGCVAGQESGDFTLVISREEKETGKDVFYDWRVLDAQGQDKGHLTCSLATLMRRADYCAAMQLEDSSAKGVFSKITGNDALDSDFIYAAMEQDTVIGSQRALEEFCKPLIIGNPRFFSFLNEVFDEVTAQDRMNLMMNYNVYGNPEP